MDLPEVLIAEEMKTRKISAALTIVTAGATYLDIDAYACMIATTELLRLQGVEAVAWSDAPCNYSVCPSLMQEGLVCKEQPSGNAQYIIVDVSDPEYLAQSVQLEQIAAIFDHHVGFEDYWRDRIGHNAHIEFIGAAATLIYREWKKAGLQNRMAPETARLLTAAILDNTLNLSSANTTPEDITAFRELCSHGGVDAHWCAGYFSQVQAGMAADLRRALLNDTKRIHANPVLPPKVAQLCVWDAEDILCRLPEIRSWMDGTWMLNLIDIQNQCSWFVCDDSASQKKITHLFGVVFENGVARTDTPYLRKEIIKRTLDHQ